ncbi:MAG: mechanosensitive ion channel domain-containing protein [Flavobacteriaceae bacterium]
MEKLGNYQQHVDNAIEWFWSIVPDIVMAMIILITGLWAIGLISRLLRRYFDKADYDPTLESFLYSLIRVSLKVILVVLVITQLGVKTSSLVAILASAGIAVGLALQGSLSNFAGGILIFVFKPFKVGDFISAQGVDGTVKEISIFTTKLTTFGNQVAIIPNGPLSNNNIVNFNAENIRRDKINVGIGYESDIKKAKQILLDICAENDAILKEPAPEVYVDSLADSAVVLTLRLWANNADFWGAHFHTMETLKNRFDEEGIKIPFPQMEVHAANKVTQSELAG